MFHRMGVNVWLKEQLNGNEHNKSLPLLSSTTTGETAE